MEALVIRIDVRKRDEGWVAERDGDTVVRASTKAAAVKQTARYARSSGDPMTVKIHMVDGKIGEERTYPRSADPRRTRG